MQAQHAPVKSPVITLRYGGNPPKPHPPVTAPTPLEEEQRSEKLREETLALKEQERLAAAQQEGGGTRSKLAKFAGGVASALEKTTSNTQAAAVQKVRTLHREKNLERFTLNFPELAAAGDQLMTDYNCKVMHQGVQVSGHIQVTTGHLCFVADALREIIPWTDVLSIQRSIALETIENGPPFIMTIPHENVVPNTLQIFTAKMQLFQFLSIESTLEQIGGVLAAVQGGSPIERLYNFIDHAWRAAVSVPVRGQAYAE